MLKDLGVNQLDLCEGKVVTDRLLTTCRSDPLPRREWAFVIDDGV